MPPSRCLSSIVADRAANLELVEGAGGASMQAPLVDFAVEDADSKTGQVSSDVFTSIADNTNEGAGVFDLVLDRRLTGEFRTSKVFEADADIHAIAKIGNDLDDLAAGEVFVFVVLEQNAGVGVVV